MAVAFLNYLDLTTYEDATALAAATTSSLANGSYAEIPGLGVFQLNKESTSTIDNTSVINALNGGRWLINYNVHIQENSTVHIDGSQISAVGDLSVSNGTAAAPSITFESDSDTGIYRVGANDVGFTTGGTLRVDISTTAVTSTLPIVNAAGSEAAPSLTFTGDLNSGIYSVGADNLGISTGGTLRFDISTTAVTSTLPFLSSGGTAAAPGLTFSSDTNSGLFPAASDQIAVSAGGVTSFLITGTHVNIPLTSFYGVGGVQVLKEQNIGWITFAGTGTKNQGAINVDTFTATDANIRLLGQAVKGILDALMDHGLLGA